MAGRGQSGSELCRETEGNDVNICKWLFGLVIGAMAVGAGAAEIGSRVMTGEVPAPVSFRSASAPLTEVAIAPSTKQLADKAVEASYGKAPLPAIAQILGVARPPVPISPLRVGSIFESGHPAAAPKWQVVRDGSVTQFRVSSKAAKGIRAKLALPTGVTLGEIRVRAPNEPVALGVPLTAAYQGEIWTPYTEGEVQLVELFTPQRAEGLPMRVVEIVHFERSLNLDGGGGGEASANQIAAGCTIDVTCTTNNTVLDDAMSEARNSVARIVFNSGGSSFQCSGTLINSNSGQNFFMTANHCISTQAEASSISFHWFYERAACGATSGTNAAYTTTGGGAQLAFTNQFVDSTLLRLNVQPPVGTIFAGWNSNAMSAGQSVVSISHPRGDVKKLALGTLSSVQNRNDGLIRLSGYEQEMYAVLFDRGIIEGGSSGSGLFTLSGNTLQYRGVLSNSTVRNGSLSCTNTNENANYGRWDYFQPQVASILNGFLPLVDDHVNQPAASSTLLTLDGPAVNAKIDYVGDLDTFRIVVTEPGTIYVKSNGGYDMIGQLLNSAGATLENASGDAATNDDASVTGLDFGIAWPVTPGTYYLLVANWIPTALTPNGYSVQASFLNATTNYTALWWAGEAESGWGLHVNHQGNGIFAAMFNYENAGLGTQNPNMWLSSSMRRVGASQSYTGRLLRVTGPAFNASPFPNQQISTIDVGDLTLDFNGASSAVLTYRVSGGGTGGNGVPVVKNIFPIVYATKPVCRFTGTDRSYSTGNFQDVWWNRNESGWGVFLTHQSNTIFATMFNYEPGTGNQNKGLWLTANLPRESTGVYAGELNRVTGSAFNAAPFTPLNPATNITRVGNMRVQFTNGNAATLTYDINGSQVVKPIERLVFDGFPTECSPP
jgi:lysyl endopeptidase